MKLGIVLYSNDPETVWNVFRLGNFSLNKGDDVKMFLLAKGVDCESEAIAVKSSSGARDPECESEAIDKFDITQEIQTFVDGGGHIFACGTCLKIRNSDGSDICPLSSMSDLYEIIQGCDKVVTF